MGTWAGAASALLVGLVLPSAAQSSCGDYLHRVPSQPGAQTRTDAPHPAPHAPCQGPTCSTHESDPLPAPAPQAPSAPDDSAPPPAVPAPPGRDGGELLALPGLHSPAHLLGSIYRPPRCLSR